MAYVYSSSSNMNAQAMEDKAERMLGIMGYCASQSMSSMGFTKTIEAEVLGVVDAIKNTYRLRYQNASFEAMSENTSIQYKRKDRVLVSIPTGDLSDPNKLIVGLLSKTGSRHVASEELDVLFDSLGRNLYAGNQEIELSSWTPAYNPIDSQNKVDYRYELNMISDAEEVSSYMKDASHIMMKFKLKTDFLPEQVHEKFGIELVLRYKRETSNEPLFRYYRFEPQNIVGSSIYNIRYYTEQSIVFELGESAKFFDGIESASVFFNSGFQTNEYQPKDVFIKNLEIRALNVIAGAATTGYHISLTAPKGAYFPIREDGDKTPEPLELKAKVYLNGVLLNENDAKLKYYWFAEDLTMTSDNPEYLKFGKEGWACINNIFSDITLTENGKEVREVEYEPGEASILIAHDQIPSREKKFKCVVTYEDIVISSSPVVIVNADANYSIEVASSLGEVLRTGQKTILTCKIKNKGEEIANLDNFIFVWKSIDLNENVSTYSSNTSILEVKAEDIEKSRTYKCGVRAKGTNGKTSYIGSADIILTNEQVAADYTLAIKNGNQVFKYDVNGASPVSRRNESPGHLEKLSFVIYDKKGQELTQEAIDIGLSWNQNNQTVSPNINWFVPAEDTFLEATIDGETKEAEKDENGNEKVDENGKPILIDTLPDKKDGYYSFHKKDLVFKIKDSYSQNYSRNQIKLTVLFKPDDKETPEILEAYTEFIFTKEGALGTNGTGAVCWIEDAQDETKNKRYLEIDNKEANQIDFTTKGVLTRFINRSYPESTKENQFSEFQWSVLKRQNELTNFIYSVDIGTGDNKDVTTSFFDFENLYKSTSKKNGAFPKDDNSRWFNNDTELKLRPIANFMKLSQQIDGKYCYSVMPIIATKYQEKFKTSDWKVCLKENTGYLSVLYETNGRYPKYDDDNDFELEVKSLTEYIVEWFAHGNFKNIVQDKDNQNKCKIVPKENYDSYSYANIVSARVYQKKDGKKGSLIATILIPIYFYINKYFNAAINEWDGNGIEINEKEGIVLSPQVGAGKKENDNSFTGVIIGSKANSGGTTETGLFGFNKGQQTIKLDATDGHAEFGVEGKGRIIIDPGKIVDNKNQPEAKIYGGNYVEGKSGLEINLTAPSIKFGSGNFKVDPSGYITAKGGGTIAGWKINNSALYDGSNTGKDAHINGSKTAVCSIDAGTYVYNTSDFPKDTYPNIDSNKKDNYSIVKKALADEGKYSRAIAVKVPPYKYNDKTYNQQLKSMAFWAGKNKFMVSHDGYLKAEEATIGSGSNSIFIGKSGDNSAIFTQNKTSLNSNASGFYLGADGIALGNASKSTDKDGNEINISRFQVDKNGTLYARSGYIGGDGKSGWTIGNTSLYNQKNGLEDDSNGVYIGTRGIGLGKLVEYKDITQKKDEDATEDKHSKFEVTNSGTLYADGGYFRGAINADSGQIGGWSIIDGNLNSGNMWINNGGSMYGSNWSISAGGLASFSNINVTGGKISLGGTTLGVDNNGTPYTELTEGNTRVGTQTLGTYVGDIVADKITADYITTKISDADLTTTGSLKANALYMGPYPYLLGATTNNNKVYIQGKEVFWTTLTINGVKHSLLTHY